MYLPATTEINTVGNLTLAGVDLVNLAQQYGTPLYVYDEELMRKNCRFFKESLQKDYPKGEVIYAGKAFLTLAMCRLILQEGLSLDVVSGGELYIALKAGFPMEQVYFHGNNKSPAELAMAVEVGVGRVIVDSLPELEQLEKEAARQGKKAGILLRVKPGVSAHTHEYIQTGQEDSKFGLGISDGQAMVAVEKALQLPHITLYGLHCHIGSQIFDSQPFHLAASIMMDLMQKIRHKTGTTLKELNLGGGFGIRYTSEDQPCSFSDITQLLSGAVREKCQEHDYPLPTVMIEPGRSIVGEAGVTLYTVGVVKNLPGILRYVSVDGGMSDNLRSALYGAHYEAALANRPQESPEEVVTIAGKACESGDILIKDIALPSPRPGDTLVIFSTGAYHFSMFSHYNRHLRPAVVFLRNGQVETVVKRETYEDIIRLESIPAHLEVRSERLEVGSGEVKSEK